jgi:hypothetical protein
MSLSSDLRGAQRGTALPLRSAPSAPPPPLLVCFLHLVLMPVGIACFRELPSKPVDFACCADLLTMPAERGFADLLTCLLKLACKSTGDIINWHELLTCRHDVRI